MTDQRAENDVIREAVKLLAQLPPTEDEAGTVLDGRKLLKDHDVLLTGTIRCVMPKGHDYLHHGEHGEIWGPTYAVCDE